MCSRHVHINHDLRRNPQPPSSSFSNSHGFHHFRSCFHAFIWIINLTLCIKTFPNHHHHGCRSSRNQLFPLRFSPTKPILPFPSFTLIFTFTPHHHSRPHFQSIIIIIIIFTSFCQIHFKLKLQPSQVPSFHKPQLHFLTIQCNFLDQRLLHLQQECQCQHKPRKTTTGWKHLHFLHAKKQQSDPSTTTFSARHHSCSNKSNHSRP